MADHKYCGEQALNREECTSGTRVRILEDITKWANNTLPESPRVFWLTGQAGSGKTTIAYTVAKRFEKDGTADQQTILGGNFLCSRQFGETREPGRIISTIAYQLARKCKSYADALHNANKFDSVNYNVPTQLTDLLVEPWQQSEATCNMQRPPFLIVIDALDEIKEDGGSIFLKELLKTIRDNHLKGIKFLVTSRPHPEVVSKFATFASKAVRWLQEVPIEEAESDIAMYLKVKLPNLASRPELVRRADGLFIYAATAVKYLTPPGITIPEQTEMLAKLLSNTSASANKATLLIDELYQQIMRDAFSRYNDDRDILDRRLRILHTFLCTPERTSISIVAALLEVHDDIVTAVLNNLHAVLYTQDNCVFWYHASFPDFVFNSARANLTFSCDEPAHQNFLGKSCFRIMKSGLRFNMGDIPSSFLFDRDHWAGLTGKVNKNVSAVLKYSCRHWTHHLPRPQSSDTGHLCRCISDFLEIRVLFWIEVMNLFELSNQCTPMLQRARQWVLKVRTVSLDLYRNN
jgi:hypothetical protein